MRWAAAGAGALSSASSLEILGEAISRVNGHFTTHTRPALDRISSINPGGGRVGSAFRVPGSRCLEAIGDGLSSSVCGRRGQ